MDSWFPYSIGSSLGSDSRAPCRERRGGSAIEALRDVVLRAAVRALGLGEKCVEWFAAFAAAPELTQRRCGFARRTGETVAPRKFGDASQRPRLFQAAP